MSAAARFSGIEARRSTRIDRTVPLVIVGQTKLGLSFQERTSAVSVNLHGCRYPSRHDYSVGSWVGLQVLESSSETNVPVVRAQVRSIHPPMSPRELYQIGVEFETPGNVWSIPAPPEDWQRMLFGTSDSKMASAATPAREVSTTTTAAPAPPASAEYRSSGVASFPAPPPAPAKAEPGAIKPERVVITSDQLVSAVQGKLQQAAEKAVHSAINSHLMEAVRSAVSKIDEVRHANVTQLELATAERLDAMVRSAKEETVTAIEMRIAEDRSRREQEDAAHRDRAEEMSQRLERMAVEMQATMADTRLVEDRGRWEEEQASYRARAEEIAQQLEQRLSDTQRELAETRAFIENVRDFEPQIRVRLSESVTRATDDFETAATRVADRQLVRLIEDKQMVTREATSQLAACAAEMKALLQTSASGALEEFRRQLEVHLDLTISEATQRLMSSLASLDAENRAACEARRQNIEIEVARATEQSTEQFRTGIKAFLYSCLVAAVGAVDEHAKTTLDGLVHDQSRSLHALTGKNDSAPPNDFTPQGQ